MKKIIALRGKGNSGKTTTIKKLPELLNNNGYSQVPDKYKSYGSDFSDIFEKNGVKIGVTSSGDTYDLVKTRLDELVAECCDVCICACRTSDRTHRGTNAATREFSDYKAEYIKKAYADGTTEQDNVNKQDAERLYKAI